MIFHLPVPGSVVGMFLLLSLLICWDKAAAYVRPMALVLISYLAVLFVPAGVGIILHIDRIKNEALPIFASLILSTVLSIAVTALVIKYSSLWLEKRSRASCPATPTAHTSGAGKHPAAERTVPQTGTEENSSTDKPSVSEDLRQCSVDAEAHPKGSEDQSHD